MPTATKPKPAEPSTDSGDRSPKDWQTFRKAIDSGDAAAIDKMRRKLELSKQQCELARLCVAEYDRLTAELEQLQASSARHDELTEQLAMLRRHRPGTTEEALSLGTLKSGLERDLHEAEKAAGTIRATENWAGGTRNICPELFGMYGDDAARAKRLGGYRAPAVGTWIAENWPDFDGDWLSESRPDESRPKLKISTLMGLRQQ